MKRETRNIEYKRDLTKSYLKAVSAYANYGTGKIYFGITDDGKRTGMASPEKNVLDLENQINDNIHPRPSFSFEIDQDNVIVLTVQKGYETPYCYHGKAYKRNDSSTVEVTSLEYKNLVLKGLNLTFTEIPAETENLTFRTFEQAFADRFGIPARFPDTYLTLGLYSPEGGYNNGAFLLSDQNSLSGIDVVMYGEDRSVIRKRHTLEGKSVLDLIDECLNLFEAEYTYEAVEGLYRIVKEQIPEDGFREVIVNAVVHREWQIPAHIKVEFFADRVTVTSPGGLPKGLSENELLSDHHISIARNTALAIVFLQLGLIEKLGTGIPKINRIYEQSSQKPVFQITDNMVSITLPQIESRLPLSREQKQVYNLIGMNQPVSSSQLLEKVNVSKSTLTRILNSLVEDHLIERTGRGRSVRYTIKQII